MTICRIILPWQFGEYPVYDEEGLQIGTRLDGGGPLYPGLAEDESVKGYGGISYTPPPIDCPYVLAEVWADQAIIDALAAQPNCLLICYVTEAGFETAPLAPQERVTIRNKIAAMEFPNLGRINAAMQASQNKAELANKLAAAAFAWNVEGELMNEWHNSGSLNRSPNP